MAKPKGGARPGAGRKSGAIEENCKAHIKRALGPNDLDEIWKKIVEMAKNGSEKHTTLLMNYYYGKPKENEGEPTEMIIRVQRNS